MLSDISEVEFVGFILCDQSEEKPQMFSFLSQLFLHKQGFLFGFIGMTVIACVIAFITMSMTVFMAMTMPMAMTMAMTMTMTMAMTMTVTMIHHWIF